MSVAVETDRYQYCKTCIEGGCAGLSDFYHFGKLVGKECVWHNSPEFCEKNHKDTVTVAYQCIGWYKTLMPESVGLSTTISDGMVFSNLDDAKTYLNTNYAKGWIEKVENPTETTVDYCFKNNERKKCTLGGVCNRQFGHSHNYCADNGRCEHKK